MGRSLLLFAGFALLLGVIFGGYCRNLATIVFQQSDHPFPSSALPIVQLVSMLVPAAIVAAIFLWRSRLARRLPARYAGRSWIIAGVAWELIVVPLLVGAQTYAIYTGKTGFGGPSIHEWFGLPGHVMLLVGCTKVLLVAHPGDDTSRV